MSTKPDTPLASLDLLRQITDRHVLDQLLAAETLTRAEIAARTGISKPTISECVRRLEEAGLLTVAGQQLGKRGRAGTFYALRDDVGFALAISASPHGLVAETSDVRGTVLHRLERATPSPVTAVQLNPLLLDLAQAALPRGRGPVLASALSLAGPVDRATGRLVHLPNAPYLVDELDARSLFADLLGPELVIDNDVNWAALAEHLQGSATDLDDFCYCYLGHGLGGAVMREGRPVRGSSGLAGEFAHIRTAGPRRLSMRLIECFAAWDLLQPGSPAIDVQRLGQVLTGGRAADRRLRDAVVEAVAGAIVSITAVLNPSGVIIGGPWSSAGNAYERIAQRVHDLSVVDVDVRPAALGDAAPIIGARLAAVRSAQAALGSV